MLPYAQSHVWPVLTWGDGENACILGLVQAA